MPNESLMYILLGGAVIYFWKTKKPAEVQAATAITAPTIGQTQPVVPGQQPIGNPLIAQLVGLTAGYLGTQMTQNR